MTIRAKKRGGAVHLNIGDELNIYSAAQKKDELLNVLHNMKDLEIDLSKVAEMDSAGLQLLLMLKREAEQQGREVRLSNHSQVVYELFELLNVATVFGDPIVIPGEWRNS